jgi:hypothetical protein
MAVALAPETLVNCVAPGLLKGTRATDINLFGNRERVVNLDAERAHCAFDFGVAEQELHDSQIFRAAVD